MSTLWYYNRAGGKPKGPVTMANLRVMGACGQLRPGDLLFQEGTKDWIPAEEIPGLCAAPLRAAEAGAPPAGMPEAAPAAAAQPAADDPLSALGAVAAGDQPAGAAHDRHGKSSHHPPARQSSSAPLVITLVIACAGLVAALVYSTHHKEQPTPTQRPLADSAASAPAPVSHSAAYQKAYQEGLTDGQNLAKQWADMSADDKGAFRDRQMLVLGAENDNIRLMMQSFEPGDDKVQELKGHADGMRDGMQQGGMTPAGQP